VDAFDAHVGTHHHLPAAGRQNGAIVTEFPTSATKLTLNRTDTVELRAGA
jgi:hypothetical protein